jgi:energy-coupling factor transporter ATP-binding protein EcfA2
MSHLQQKLIKIQGLLPSQRSWLERLVFQLEFNPYQLIHMVGPAGSGKTTLTLAIADLLSNEFNLALIKAEPELSAVQVRQHVLEHWFGTCKDANRSLLQLVGDRQLDEPLALVIDQAEQLPVELWAELAELPCLVIAATEHSDAHAELNLPLPALTLQDAEMLLKDSELSTLSVADRLDNAQGNIHLLLDPSLKRQQQVVKVDLKPASLAYPLTVFSVGMLAIAAVVVFWLWTEQQSSPAGLGQLTYLPEEQEVQTSVNSFANPPASKAVVEQLVGQLETVGSKTASSAATGLAKPVDFLEGSEVSSSAAEPVTQTANDVAQTEQQPASANNTADSRTPNAESAVVVAEPSTLPMDKVDASSGADDNKVPDLSQGVAAQPAKPEIQIAAETEVSVAEQMAEELNDEPAPQPSVAPSTEPDLAAEAQAELAASNPNTGGYAYAEADLLSMSGQAVALQLVVLSNDNALKDFAASYPRLETYTYQRLKNGQRQLIVVMAPFADSTEAKAQLSQLPPALQQAFVKPLADIHSEISIQ